MCKLLLPSSTDVEMKLSMDNEFSVALKPGPRPPKPRPRPIGQPPPRRPSPIGRHLYVDETDEKFTVFSAPYSTPTSNPRPKPNPRPQPRPKSRPCRPEEQLTNLIRISGHA